ncbi:MAG: DEAD/DEAH box helicase [Gemmataceae bacterium]|nr:DEAD/DEAH box helicase [Gemmataceae bacterium]
MTFQELGLPGPLLRNLQNLGYEVPTPIQAQAIPVVRAGKDLTGTAQTGTGKTAAFVLPLLEQLLAKPGRGTRALILTPTRELATQIHGVIRGLAAGTNLKTEVVIGGAPMFPQVRALRQGVDIVVATPGRLMAHLRDNGIDFPGVRTLVLDEADQMFDMGFFPEVKRILSFLPKQRQTLLFSATMPPEVAKLSQSILKSPERISVGETGKAAATVSFTAYPVPGPRKTALFKHLFESFVDPSVIVFTRTRRGAKKLTKWLKDVGIHAGELHADCSPSQRERVMHGFRLQKFPVLVATNIAARGLDVRHITHVINYDVPMAPEEYVHRIGRTGRAGDEGAALTLVTPEERGQFERIERQLGKKIPRVKIEDFDYGAPAELAERRPSATATLAPKPKKRYRGQGRR